MAILIASGILIAFGIGIAVEIGGCPLDKLLMGVKRNQVYLISEVESRCRMARAMP